MLFFSFLKHNVFAKFFRVLSELKLLLSRLFILSGNVRTCAFCCELYEFIL